MNNALVYRIDRADGGFDRRIILQDNADAETVNAEFNDGVVKLHIAGAKRLDPNKIEADISGTARPHATNFYKEQQPVVGKSVGLHLTDMPLE